MLEKSQNACSLYLGGFSFFFSDIQLPGSRFLMQSPGKKLPWGVHVLLDCFLPDSFLFVLFLWGKKMKLYLFHFQTFPVIARTTKRTKVESIDLQGFHTAFLWSFGCSLYRIKKSNTENNLTRSLVSALLGWEYFNISDCSIVHIKKKDLKSD